MPAASNPFFVAFKRLPVPAFLALGFAIAIHNKLDQAEESAVEQLATRHTRQEEKITRDF